MTTTDRLELGLFMALLAGGLIVLTGVMKLGSVPRMAAWSDRNQTATQTSAQAQPITPSTQPMSVLLPEIPNPSGATQLPQWFAPAQPQELPVAPPALPPSAQRLPVERAPSVAPKPKPPEDIKYYQGEKYRLARSVKLRVTAYAPDPRCTYPYPGTTTASGKSVKTNGGRLVAADTSVIPMHALVVVPGYAKGAAVPVLDRGGAIKGARLDLLMPTFEQAQDWGSKELAVKVYVPVK